MSDKDKRILMYAFRYSLGRMTGAVDDVISTILNNVDFFASWELKSFIQEIKDYPNLNICRREWYTFIEKLEELI